jgi:tRNA pseudouridine55 synthase
MCEAGKCGTACGCSQTRLEYGILNVDKPAGMTSHDVVNIVRRIAGTRRVGHAGTLDPLATGVLLICIGQATRISEYLMHSRKAYRAEVQFGSATSTYDAEGEVTDAFSTQGLDAEFLASTLSSFVGTIQQQVPLYSAVKQNGQPLYRRARRGEDVEPPSRPVEIYRADLLAWEPSVATIEVECGPGTYIRSLAHDWGRAVNNGAHLKSLRRLASGSFIVDNAVSLDRLQQAAEDGCWDRYLMPMDEGLLDMEAILVAAPQADALRRGQSIESRAGEDRQLARAYTLSGDFLALIRYNTSTGWWDPHKVFAGE